MEWLICNHKMKRLCDLEGFLDILICMNRHKIKSKDFWMEYQEIHNMYGYILFYYLYIINGKVTFLLPHQK